MRLPALPCLTAVLSLVLAPVAASAQASLECAKRLQFLESRLSEQKEYADLWWHAWNGVYLGGIAVQGTRAGFEDASGERADLLVSVAKSGIGLVRNLTAPPAARRGVPTERDLACERQVELAAERLDENAEEALEERWGWKSHLGNLGLNLIGGLIVAEGFDEGSGWGSAAVGFAFGEARIWSYPFQAIGDREDWRRGAADRGLAWRVEPFHQGARVRIEF